ncbi:dipicolinate synthase subunit A [Pelagirhabdus alkalitolerans]|uniref:Dipicolinate synthase subunit A n=1 Tax=Pelagirhabdus alkalitolerans TaxID=1612202 RepID=A0A1G6H6N4_9BACI|nr:dipicolinate synthase subunit DpsA [Pelagirhabdus alkalitolerans]SDB89116.1 dipicolinate synthase subunit A [Pelagirhabdus alkalitolerans]
MNSMIHLAIIGGDERNAELIDTLINKDYYQLYLIGYDDYQSEFDRVTHMSLDQLENQYLDFILLPINGVSKDGGVKAVYAKETISLSPEWFEKTGKSTIILTGIMTDYLTEQVQRNNINCLEIMSRNDVAIKNAVPTAEGTVQLALETMDRTIHGAKTIVLGFGRVGYTVAHTFNQLHADVRVGVRKTEDIARAETINLEGFHLNQLDEAIQNCDLLINTIPALIITRDHLKKLNKNCLIIDLASKPGGVDFKAATEENLRAIHALGLPAKVAPKTAGQILAYTIDQMIRESN